MGFTDNKRQLRVGYSWYGHLADVKYKEGVLASTPDGNATYSWAIIRALQKQGHVVYRMMANRDVEAVAKLGARAFSAFCTADRYSAYSDLRLSPTELPELDLLLHEWRMPIPGRNTPDDQHLMEFEPDLLRQEQLLNHYNRRGDRCKIVGFDLDYSMTHADDARCDDVLELGTSRGPQHQVHVPTTREMVYAYSPRPTMPVLSYIGNRYARDESVDAYLAPLAQAGVRVDLYGNWLERGRDSAQRWPFFHYHPRLQLAGFKDVLSQTAVVPLLLKQEYYDHSFMTARIIETVAFGALPALPTSFVGWQEWVPEELTFSSSDQLALIVAKSLNLSWKRHQIDSVRANVVRLCSDVDFIRRLLSVLPDHVNSPK